MLCGIAVPCQCSVRKKLDPQEDRVERTQEDRVERTVV